MHAKRLKIVMTHGRKGDLTIRQDGDLRTICGMDGVDGDIINNLALYVGDILYPEVGKFARRHVPDAFEFIHSLPFLAPRDGRRLRI